MKDITKRTLELGNRVVFVEPGYRSMMIGRVQKFTPKMVTIEYGSSNRERENIFTVNKFPNDVAIIPEDCL